MCNCIGAIDGLGRGNLEEREHGVRDVVEVLGQHRHPLPLLLVAECRVLDQRSAVVLALAPSLAPMFQADAIVDVFILLLLFCVIACLEPIFQVCGQLNSSFVSGKYINIAKKSPVTMLA